MNVAEEKQAYWYECGGPELRMDESYEVLHGPDGFECMITEPEDRTFGRDLKDAVKRLNEQHAELVRLRRIQNHYAELHAAGVDNWEGYRHSYGTDE